jgi:hypothetical protein
MGMSHRTTPRVPEFIVWAALLCPVAGWSQTPPRPGRLHVTSTPDGAVITVDGKPMNQRTPTVLVVAPGTYTVSVAGQAGKSTCREAAFAVASGAIVEVDCSGGVWK